MRSVTGIQPLVSSVCEVMVFLEVLGYDDNNAAGVNLRILFNATYHSGATSLYVSSLLTHLEEIILSRFS